MTIQQSAITSQMHAASAATIQMWTLSTVSHLTILGLSLLAHSNLTKVYRQTADCMTQQISSAVRPNNDCVILSWAMSLSGCVAVLRVSNRSVQQALTKKCCQGTRPMKPRQSGRTISIRSAKQYRSFHMPAHSTSSRGGLLL